MRKKNGSRNLYVRVSVRLFLSVQKLVSRRRHLDACLLANAVPKLRARHNVVVIIKKANVAVGIFSYTGSLGLFAGGKMMVASTDFPSNFKTTSSLSDSLSEPSLHEAESSINGFLGIVGLV